MKTFAPLKFKRLASDWKTEMAELGAWVLMEDAPIEPVRQLVAFFVHEALLNMRRNHVNRLVDKDFRHDEWLLSGLPDDDEDIELDDGHDDKDREAELNEEK